MYFKSIVTHYKTKLIQLLVQADLHFFYFLFSLMLTWEKIHKYVIFFLSGWHQKIIEKH